VDDRPRRSIFLAPHYDDVALSCGGTVAALSDAGGIPLVVTVFGGVPAGALTQFARDMHDRWGVGPRDAVAMRRQEERCAESALGAESIWLDFLDAIYRDDRYNSDPDIFGSIHPDDVELVDAVLAELLRRLGHATDEKHVYYVPLAVGNHVDHQLTLMVGRRLADAGHAVWAYEDFPYAGDPAWADGVLQQVRSVTSSGSRLESLSVEQIECKVTAVLCYRSQLDVIFRFQGDPEQSIRRYAEVVGGGKPAERFWRIGA
jgi:LmbE family N-acetylglucosaminyl deacetylase